MWLERFSAQSTQSTPSSTTPTRSYSPAPRRSIQLGPSTLPRRPGLSPRTSSLSVGSLGGSTESLPATARVPNGSNLKNELSSAPTPDIPDPVDVLESILGPLQKSSEDDGNVRDEIEGTPAALSEDIDFGG